MGLGWFVGAGGCCGGCAGGACIDFLVRVVCRTTPVLPLEPGANPLLIHANPC